MYIIKAKKNNEEVVWCGFTLNWCLDDKDNGFILSYQNQNDVNQAIQQLPKYSFISSVHSVEI